MLPAQTSFLSQWQGSPSARQSSCIQAVMAGKHLKTPAFLMHDHRSQNPMFPDALHHVIQPLAFIQTEWMIVEQLGLIYRKALKTDVSLRLRRIRNHYVHCVRYLSLWYVSLYIQSPPRQFLIRRNDKFPILVLDHKQIINIEAQFLNPLTLQYDHRR